MNAMTYNRSFFNQKIKILMYTSSIWCIEGLLESLLLWASSFRLEEQEIGVEKNQKKAVGVI